MSLLQDVVDVDDVASFAPLTFDMGFNLVRGADAILRRVLYLWCTLLGTLLHAPGLGMTTPLLDLDGSTFSPFQLQGLRTTLAAQAKEVAFVDECSVTLTFLPSGMLIVSALITLSDNKAYALELSITDARPILLRLGSTTS